MNTMNTVNTHPHFPLQFVKQAYQMQIVRDEDAGGWDPTDIFILVCGG
jgi:hypothetical protein